MSGRFRVACWGRGVSKRACSATVLKALATELLLTLVFVLMGCASPDTCSLPRPSSNPPDPISGSLESSSGTVALDVRDEWFGHVRGDGEGAAVVDFSGIEGEYRDLRDGGPTGTHGFYSYFNIGPLTVSKDGMYATGTLDMRWVPHLGEEVRGGVAEFTCDVSVLFDPRHDGLLVCSVSSRQGDLNSEAKIVDKGDGSIEFLWLGGSMRPDYVKAVGEDAVKLDTSLVKAADSAPGVAASPSEGASTAGLDVDVREDRILANKFLSWLSLCMPQRSTSADISDITADVDTQVSFCVWYLGITQDPALERGDYGPAASARGNTELRTNARVSERAIQRVAGEFFGTSPDLGKVSANTPYTFKDGYVYFSTTAPFGQTAYWSAVTSAEEIGDSQYKLSFDIYIDKTSYTLKSDIFYAMDSAGMAAECGTGSPRGRGEAVVEVVDESGSKALRLKSYKVEAAGNGEEAPDDSPTVITTPYYTITIPAGWPEGYGGQLDYTVDAELGEDAGSSEFGIGCVTDVSVGGELFEVICLTNNWGVQGDFVGKAVGTPGNLPGWHVVAYIQTKSPKDDTSGEYSQMLNEFVSFITLASGE